jgi:phage shock protein PspC (stress-responsive transcriptional regulator)
MTTPPHDDTNPPADRGPQLGLPELGSATMTAPPPGTGTGTGDRQGGTDADYHEHDRLHRGGPHRMLAGVAVGLADYFDIDPTLVRVGFVVLSFLGGLAVPLYLAGWLLIPEEGAEQSVAEELLARERIR